MKHWKTSFACIISCLTLSACADSSDDDGCSYTTPRCNADGTALLTCDVSTGIENAQTCTCVNNKCEDAPKCDYTTPKCNDAGTALLTCTNGEEFSRTCTCKNGACEEEAPKCDYTVPKCNDAGTALLTCTNGEEFSKSCTCKDGKCEVEVPKCDYTVPKCNANGTALLTCTNGVESSQTCTCKDGKCESAPVVEVPKVSGINPTSGKVDTPVSVNGSNLQKTSEVCFGSSCVTPAASDIKDTSVTVKAPAGTGSVSVVAVVDGKRLNAGTFNYLTESENKNEIDWCQLTWVEPSILPDQEVGAYAQVYEEGKTGAGSSHADVVGQVGYIDAGSDQASDILAYTWVDASRNPSFAGDAAAANDEYMADGLILPEGSYRVAYRFSLDGTNWKYCDLDGSNDGFDVAKTGTFTVAAKPVIQKKVDWCRIMNEPTSMASEVGETSDAVYAQAFVDNCTDAVNHCPDLVAQIGYGSPALSSADALADGFTWKDAVINPNFDGSVTPKHDEFMANLSTDKAGTYSVLYRMSVDGKKTWTYCDTSDDVSFTASDAVTWTVSEKELPPDPPAKTIEWCRIQSPASIDVRAGQELPAVYGRVYVPDCTESGKTCPDLKAQLGYGTGTKPEAFTYTDAVQNPDDKALDIGNNDEYMATIDAKKAGDYSYVYRFSLDGENWTYCDYDDVIGFDIKNAGKLTIREDKDTVAWCRIQYPQSQEIVTGNESAPIFGQVLVTGCTEGAKKCEKVTAEVGYGDPAAKSPNGFKYTKAEYNEAMTTTNNDEYMATLAPAEAGEYAVAYRFKTSDDADWTYCDFDDEAGFLMDKAAKITVKDPPDTSLKIEWCKLVSEAEMTAPLGKSVGVYGQAFVQTCTEDEGACEFLKAYIGYGAKGAKTAEDFTFVEATYNKQVGYNDEFGGTIKPTAAGEYDVIYAFSLDGGKTMTYCDTDKQADSPATGKPAKLTVTEPLPEFVRGTDFDCGIDGSQASMDTKVDAVNDIYGQIWIKGCTEGKAEKCPNVVGSHLHYIQTPFLKSEPIATSTKWTLVEAAYDKKVGNNDEYKAGVKFPAGNYSYAYSFDLKHDPSDESETAQRVFCFVNWAYGFGTAVVYEN